MAGDITHIEFPADDIERAKRFYGAVAGWEFSTMEGFPDYWLFRTQRSRRRRDRQDVATRRQGHPGVHQRGVARGRGGRRGSEWRERRDPPTDVPGQGRFAAVNDSEGNEIGLWQNLAG